MLYERVDVFRSLQGSNAFVAYRCFRLRGGTGYVVQSMDRIQLPVSQSDLAGHEARLAELFVEDEPGRRSQCFPTLEEAIRAFDEEFGNIWE